MRKILAAGLLLLVVMGISVGAIFAQDAESTPEAGQNTRTWLGVSVADADEQVVITRVRTGSPANAADLLIGDVIVSLDGEAVTSAAALTELVAAATPGDVVTLEVLRNEETINVEVTLGSKPVNQRGHRFDNLPEDALSAVELLVYADLQAADNGFAVTNVFAGRNPFDLVEGDVITTINEQAVTDLDVAALVTALSAADDATLTVVLTRDGEEITVTEALRGQRGGHRGGHGGGRGGRDGFGNDDDRNDVLPEATPEPGTLG